MTRFDAESRTGATGASAANQPPKHALVIDWNFQASPSLELLSSDRTPVQQQELSFSDGRHLRSSERRFERERHVVLAEDAEIVALVDLPASIRRQINGCDGDFVLLRPYTPVQVIDSCAAALLEQFERSNTIVDAILAYSRKIRVRPSEVLEYAFPLIQGFILAGVLVQPGVNAGVPRP